jgi:hypothetical protein
MIPGWENPAIRVAIKGADVIRFDVPEVRGTNHMAAIIIGLDQDTEAARREAR